MQANTLQVDTISLVGMPGAGKSTVGVILAKATGLRFIDTDLEMQRRMGATLQEMLEARGHLYLRQVEEQVLLDPDLDLSQAVISTGGSVVYCEPGMKRLRAAGPVVYLRCDLSVLERRIADAPPRGIADDPGNSFAQVFAQRVPLYERYADFTVDAGCGTADQVASAIVALLR